jgi:predicted PurR-regulated permease PerM
MNGDASLLPPSAPQPLPEPQDPHDGAFRLLLAAITLAFLCVLWPLYSAVLWGVIIAILFAPLNGWMLRRLSGGRNRAALCTVLVVLVGVMLPLGLVAAALVQEAASMVNRLQRGDVNVATYFDQVLAVVPHWLADWLSRLGLGSLGALQQKVVASLSSGGKLIATQALGIGQNTFEFIVNFFVTLYLSYFLLRDGAWLKKKVGAAVPLAPHHRSKLFDKFATVIRATVKGNVLVAATQGALGGLAFWFLDVHGALLWAVLMAVLSLLPAVGAGLVWLPVALYFLATGAVWQGVALTLWGTLVIGLVDNLLRPLLVGKDTKLPDYLVLISTLGGMALFGLNGFVIGPVIAALFIAAWDIYASPR